jgi:hypothetical protein
MVLYESLYWGVSFGFVDESFQVWLKLEVRGNQCVSAHTNFHSSYVSKENKGVSWNTYLFSRLYNVSTSSCPH